MLQDKSNMSNIVFQCIYLVDIIEKYINVLRKVCLIIYLCFQATSLSTQESTVKALKSTLDKIDPMDYKTIKSVNDETNRIKKALKVRKPKIKRKSLMQKC